MSGYKFLVFIVLISFISDIFCEDDVIDFKKIEQRNRIVGGTPANITQFPYQVQLFIGPNFQSLCGGTLIKLDLVLTAAHCLYMPLSNGKFQLAKPHEITVVAGIPTLTSKPLPLNTRQVIKVTPHKQYSTNANRNDNDVALLKLASSFNESTSIRSIPMRTKSTNTNENCVVSGWGVQAENSSNASNLLLMVRVPIRDFSSCRTFYKSQYGVDITSNMICAGEHLKDACQGDSGGPLVCNSEVTGVVSFGAGCGRAQAPGVYMEVAKYNKWIVKNSADRISFTFSTLFVLLSVFKYLLFG